MTKKLLYVFIFFIFNFNGYSQSIIDDIDGQSSTFAAGAPELSTEKIEKISASGRILILTNNSGSFGKGDFISLVLENQLVNRAIVAKTKDGSGGIKLIKVYNPEINRLLKPGMEVQVIRGDDSYFNLKKTAGTKEEASLIEDEEGLFDETTLLEDDLNLDENSKREIKTDNIISLYLSQIEGQDVDGSATRESQIAGSWSYQLDDNIWGEVGYGQSVINDYPASGFDTKLSSLTFKIKYTVSAPFYSYIQPYAGYQIISADSPGAGSEGVSDEIRNSELELVENLKKNRAIFGVTILKRLVPGWFARLDVGSDALSFGFALEF